MRARVSTLLVPGEHILILLLKLSVSPPEPAFQPENLKKKDVVEILSHKKAYNACKCRKETAPSYVNMTYVLCTLCLSNVLLLMRNACSFYPPCALHTVERNFNDTVENSSQCDERFHQQPGTR